MKLSPKQREALDFVAAGKFLPGLVKEEDGWHARWHAVRSDVCGGTAEDALVDGWVDEFVRSAAMTRLSEDAEEQRHETLHDAWMMALKSATGLVVWDDAECEAFSEELVEWSGSATEDVEARRALRFCLQPGETAEAPFRIRCTWPKGRRALKALGSSVHVWGPLRGLRAEPDRTGLVVELTRAETESFLRAGARELLDAGYGVEGVNLEAGITASAELSTEEREPPAGAHAPPPEFKLIVRVAGEPVTADEIRFLLDQGSSLVFFRDHWIEVDRNILREALRALEKGLPKKADPLVFAMGIGRIGQLEIESLEAHGWIRGLVNELRSAGELAREIGASNDLSEIKGFKGDLRSYQRRGVAWIRFLTKRGFGALLADDMGLGKTVQTIAWLLSVREPEEKPALIVAPLTLLSNWRHEFAAFAPGQRILVHQGDQRHLAIGFSRALQATDVVITSYNLLVRDHSLFAGCEWSALVLDEAQAIKNPDTQVARAVKAIAPSRRLALTGTPVENSVADLWALEDFLNPGFLGERREFIERFARPIDRDGSCSAGRRLRHALEPFVLRRLKTAPEISVELGEKREIREYCGLSPAQRRDYESALEDFRLRERRAGDVFALITELKLICDGEGKLQRLCDLLEQIFAAGESALVFSQYAKVGTWLQKELATRFGRKFPFLHGSLGVSQREEQIRIFNRRGPTAFILSLKAGGYGLNLTKATHVIHFDRWWNPAVENQATDRAHRIGQTKTVFVHAFITSGTLEEHVEEILARKSLAAGSVISETEWLAAAQLDPEDA